MPSLATVSQALIRLLWHGHQVMDKQLASWMVYGILQDQHGEFFIRRQVDRDREHGSYHADNTEKLAQLSTDEDMLPEYIPMHVAESDLFAGKAARILRNPTPAFGSGDAVYQQIPKSFQKIQGLAGRFPLQKETVNSQGLGEDLPPQSEADKIEAMLLDLKLVVVRAYLNGLLEGLERLFSSGKRLQ